MTRPDPIAISLEEGATLPAEWSLDPNILALEQERVFGQSWQFACFTADIPRPGDYVTFSVGLARAIAVRDGDGGVRAFANVCPHRGAQVVEEGCGHRMSLQCPYHAWTFDLDGSLRNAPRAERNPEFDPSAISLVAFRAAVHGPFVFVNPGTAAEPFAAVYKDWVAYCAERGEDLSAWQRPGERRAWPIAANWKTVIENNMECYHCPTNHQGLAARFDVTQDHVLEAFDCGCAYGVPDADSQRLGVGVNYLWPNSFIAHLGESAAIVDQVLPVDAENAVYLRRYCFAENLSAVERVEQMAFWDAVAGEDQELCALVQRGMRSPYYRAGTMLPRTEAVIRHFHRFVHHALTAES